MNNRHFDPGMRAILLHPERWRLITPFFPPEVGPVTNGRHQRWRETHEAAPHALSMFDILVALRDRTVRGFGKAVYPCVPGTVFVFDEST
ncbi:MAG: hypothetical protein HY343_10240, partial [Lentisphaerae bacterium]|nr:hypothetical protein [Lentisphaerota bacterium]